MTRVVLGVLLGLGAAACSGQQPAQAGPDPVFPADYAASYTLVRDCRKSGDHELDFIRVLADADALGPYQDRSTPFPDGAVVLKEQYDVSDATCSGPIVKWTVMQKDAAQAARLGWDWQSVDAKRRVLTSNDSACFGCHEGCTGAPAVGYDHTCTEP